jgi:hypothetical protein
MSLDPQHPSFTHLRQAPPMAPPAADVFFHRELAAAEGCPSPKQQPRLEVCIPLRFNKITAIHLVMSGSD